MPFGSIFGAFFFLFCAWLGLAFIGAEGTSTRLGGVLLSVLGLALALGLFTRRPWARWAAVLASLGMVLLGGWQVNDRGTTLDFAVVLAALMTAVLLLLRATGEADPRPAEDRRRGGGFGRVLGWTAAASAVGLLMVGATQFVGGSGSSTWAAGQAGAAEAAKPPLQLAGLNSHVVWSDFGSAVEQARAEGKPLLVTFETSWCGYCKKMDQVTWKHPSVVERMAEMVPVKVDTEDGRTRKGFSGVQLAGQYQISGTPTTMLMDAEGRVLARRSGYLEPRQFLSWLEGALGGAGKLRVSGS